MNDEFLTWRLALGAEWFQRVAEIEQQLLRTHQRIYPDAQHRLEALRLTPFDKVKVVILGQDPYHQPQQAHGLAFSVLKGVQTPPSLANIFTELWNDLGIDHRQCTNLSGWATQGVLLLNTSLSVIESLPMSHQNVGWGPLTDKIIMALNLSPQPIVFILWGKPAQTKKLLITHSQHLVLESPHPSPLSAHRGFFGCKHFSKANQFLKQIGSSPIEWSW